MGSMDFEAPVAAMSVFVASFQSSDLQGQSLVDGEQLEEPMP